MPTDTRYPPPHVVPAADPAQADHQALNDLIQTLEARFDAADPATRAQVLADIAALIARECGDGAAPPARLCDLQRRLAETVIDDSFDNMPI